MKVIIYGAGYRTEDFFRDCPYLDYLKIICIADRDMGKWGQNYYGYEVCKPDVIREHKWQKIIVTPDAYREIYIQLCKEFDLTENDLMRPEDLFVPEIYNLGSLELACRYDDAYDIRDIIPSKIIPHNRLEQFFFFERHRVIWKWWHYFEIYHKYFSNYVNKEVRILEIGVYKGGSLQMWKDYFGEKALITGIDIDSACKQYEEERVNVCIGSQDDQDFLKQVSEQYGPFDIVLDDGGHQVVHQTVTFETMFPLLKPGGIYLIEDLHSSYWPEFGGMPYKPGTFLEYSKNFIDCLHIQHMDEKYQELMPQYAGEINACHYYDSVLVIEKKFRGRGQTTMRGE